MSDPRNGLGTGREGGPPTLSASEAEEIDRLCDRFEAAWRSGDHPRLEDQLRGEGRFRSTLKAELMAVELEWRRRDKGAALSARSLLETLDSTIGAVPHVLLRDTDGGPEPPLLRPNHKAGDGAGLRYRIDGEIARGGMGSVLKGHDPDIGRDVALKVLRDDFRNDPDMVRRFVEEVQIGGQLQHPGIVPIYEIGAFADQRPYFSMKLVKGDTLAQLLGGRKNPDDQLPRFLSIFGSIAQTAAYAHARGVIHRDLKPSNVMVGSFGEVQVMDWGLAKVLPRGGVVDDEHAGKLPKGETIIATARSGSADSDLSRAGSVLGTPSFMAPEQARGEIDRVDERADVFALGSILCEILSGQPAFTGRLAGEIQRKAAVGDLADAFTRLDASGADAELIALAKDCLAREPEDRPRSAAIVSNRVTAYLAGVQDRLRRSELERVEERARRRLTTVAAAAVILLTLLGGGGYAWNQRQHAERMAKIRQGVDEALADASRLLGEARSAPPGDVGRWSAAVGAAKRAEGLLAQGETDELLRRRVDSLATEVERDRSAAAEKARQIEIDRVLLADLESVRGNRVDHRRDLRRTDTGYAEVFRKAGLDLDATDAEQAGRWLAARTEPIEMAGYLDDWAFTRRGLSRPEADWRRLVAAARFGDADPWRDALRAKFGADDAETVAEFRRIANDPKLEDQPAPGLLLLARQLKFGCGDSARAAEVLRRAARRYPNDFRIHFELAQAPGATEGPVVSLFPNPEEAVQHLTAALAIRPRSVSTHVVLSTAMLSRRALAEAEAECREAIRLKPDEYLPHTALGNTLRWQGKLVEAESECRIAIRLRPDYPGAHSILGMVLVEQGKHALGAEQKREAIRLSPDESELYVSLAMTLQEMGEYAEAAAVLRQSRLRGVRLATTPYHSAEWLAKVEPLAALADRLPAILKGADRPKDITERLELAQICYRKRLFAASARFWAEALDEEPKLGDNRVAQHRYNAACSAALTVGGQGMDQPAPDDDARTDLRRQALRWLEAELTDWTKHLESDPPRNRETAVRIMRHWKTDTDLAEVRDPHALTKLLETERKQWLALWDKVDALLRKAGEPTSK